MAARKYGIYEIKRCSGARTYSPNRAVFSTNDINEVYQKLAKRYAYITKYKHCQSIYCDKYYSSGVCKAQWEVRETE